MMTTRVAIAAAVTITIVAISAENGAMRNWFEGVRYEVLCDDFVPATPPPAPPLKASELRLRKVRVTMIRHAESEWNRFTHAASLLEALHVLWRALARDVNAAVFGMRDAGLYDAPLSDLGIEQAAALGKGIAAAGGDASLAAVRTALAVAVGSAAPGRNAVVVLASNLRRTMETALTTLNHAAGGTTTAATCQVVIDSDLQESCCHIDALSLQRSAGEAMHPDTILRFGSGGGDASGGVKKLSMSGIDFVTDSRLNRGNKMVGRNMSAWQRNDAFVKKLFSGAHFFSNPPGKEVDDDAAIDVLIFGHSSWIRRFVDRYLGRDDIAIDARLARTKKLSNCGVLQFDMRVVARGSTASNNNEELLHDAQIDSSSLRLLRGGFV